MQDICASLFELQLSEVSESTSKKNTPKCDSLNNFMLLTEIENECKIKFTTSSMTN